MSRKNLDHHKKKKYAPDSSSSSSSSSSGDDAYAAGNWSSRSSSSSSSGSDSYEEKTRTNSKKSTRTDAKAEADVKFKTVEYHFDYNTTPAGRFDSNGELKHGGDIILSLKNERLESGYKKHHQDFVRDGRTREIVKSIRLKDVTVVGWEGAINIAYPTVPAFKNEKFGDAGHVCKRLAPNVLSSQPQDILVMERAITNASIDFQKQYPDLDPQKFDKHVQFTSDFATVPLNSPVLDHYNAAPENRKRQLTKASKPFEKKGLVIMEVEDAKKFSEMAKKQMENRISYGDVTHDFEMRLSVPTPSDRVRLHKKFEAGDKEGVQFKRFADAGYAMPGVDLKAKDANGMTMKEKFMGQRQRFAGVVEIQYYSESVASKK